MGARRLATIGAVLGLVAGVAFVGPALAASPTVTSAGPHVYQGGSYIDVTIVGTDFTPSASVRLGVGTTVSTVTFISATKLIANVSVAPDAVRGPRTVRVTTAAGTGSCTGCWLVANAPKVTSV